MRQRVDLGDRRDVYLAGRRIADRHTDDELAVLGDIVELESVTLMDQRITRVPPLSPRVRKLDMQRIPTLTTLDGIERATGIEQLELYDLKNLDFERAFESLAELPNLVTLHLGGPSFTRLPRAIAKASTVMSLELVACEDLDLDAAFAALAKLPYLRLLRLGSMPVALPASLGGLRALERLEASSNKLAALPASIGKLAKLRELDVHDNKLAALPDELCRCTALEVLDASANPLRSLPARIGALASLRELDVRRTKLKELPDSAAKLVALSSLALPDTVTRVPEAMFERELDSFDGLRALAKRFTLRDVPTPDEDELYLGEPERMPASFGQPSKLELELWGYAKRLPQLARLTRIEQVSLTALRDLDIALVPLAKCPTLAKLFVHGEYRALPASLGGVRSLRELHVTAPLKSLPRELAKLTRLEVLSIADCKLAALPDEIGELTALTEIDIHGEVALQRLPRTIGKLRALRKLALWNVDQLGLPDELAECRELTDVSVSAGAKRDAVKNLGVLAKLPKLVKLEVSELGKLDVKALIRALAGSALVELDLHDVKLAALPAEIAGLSNLERLDISGSGISKLPRELAACAKLRAISYSRWDIRDDIKPLLPPGRWKKSEHRGTVRYSRTA